MHKSVLASSIQRRIHRAFEHVRRDGGLTLREGREIDHHRPVRTEGSYSFPNPPIHWHDVSYEELEEFSDTLPFLDGLGFRFYLPALMCATLLLGEDAESDLLERLLYSLATHDTVVRVASLLSPDQCRSVVDFLAFLFLGSSDLIDEFMRESVANALAVWARWYGEVDEKSRQPGRW